MGEAVMKESSEVEVGGEGKTLVKGFRDKTVVLPLALLQKRVDSTFKEVERNLQQMQNGNMQTFQYFMQSLGQLQRQMSKIDRTLEAVVNLSGFGDEAIQAEIDKIVAKEQAEAEVSEDTRLNRVVVNRPAQLGDTVKIDYVGTVGGEEFKGGSAKGYHLELGSSSFVPDFEDQLIGAEAGKTTEVKITFPSDYGNKDLAGKDAVFAVTTLAVKEKQEVSEVFETTEG